jgi:serine/threonine protein phosphatase PrpC
LIGGLYLDGEYILLALIKQLIAKRTPNGFLNKSAKQSGSEKENLFTNESLFRQQLNVFSCQSPGKERFHNEDSLFVLNTTLSGVEGAISFGIFLVADGMGGHQNGEVASFLAAQAASKYLFDHVFERVVFQKKPIGELEPEKLVRQAVAEAQKLIYQRVPGGGTTLTLVLAIGEHLFSAHVGDSRLYLLKSDGKMTLSTRDHSLVKRLVDLGEISEREASFHPQRNVLYRALGQTDPFEPDVDAFDLDLGEKLLICSDGLWSVLEVQQIQNIIEGTSDLEGAACELVQAANDAGGPDNISVILVERVS